MSHLEAALLKDIGFVASRFVGMPRDPRYVVRGEVEGSRPKHGECWTLERLTMDMQVPQRQQVSLPPVHFKQRSGALSFARMFHETELARGDQYLYKVIIVQKPAETHHIWED